MKTLKLSLATAIAVGSFATSAFATPLDQAIKDVDVSGYFRLRYNDLKTKEKFKHGKDEKEQVGQWDFRSIVNLKVKIDDSFFINAAVRLRDTDNGSSKFNSYSSNEGAPDSNVKWDMYQAYLGYQYAGSTFMLGRWEVGSFFTDDMYADGIKYVDTNIEGMTLTGFFADALEDDPDISSSWDLGSLDGRYTYQNNLYGASIAGSYSPINFSFNYAALQDTANFFAFDLGTDFEIDDNLKFGLLGQYAFTTINNGFDNAVYSKFGAKAADSNFYAAQLSTNLFGLNIAGGYINFSTDKDAVSMTSFEDQGQFLSPGEELLGYALYAGKNQLGFGTIAYTIPDTGVTLGVDYLNGERKVRAGYDTKARTYDMSEIVGRIEYKYNDKLKFKTWWSHVKDEFSFDYDEVAGLIGHNITQDKIRFEAKYTF